MTTTTTNTPSTPVEQCFSTVGTTCIRCNAANTQLCAECNTGYKLNTAGTRCVQAGQSSAAELSQSMYVCLMTLLIIVVALFVR